MMLLDWQSLSLDEGECWDRFCFFFFSVMHLYLHRPLMDSNAAAKGLETRLRGIKT